MADQQLPVSNGSADSDATMTMAELLEQVYDLKAIRRGDGDALFKHFTRTRAIRRGVIDAGQDTPDADFGRPHGHED